MFKFLRKNNMIDGNWLKVSDLKVGMQIAVPNDGVLDAHNSGQINSREWIGDDVLWDEIESIEYVGTEQVWDIEVEDTHNFVGNNIFAHNTYIENGNLGVGYNPSTITNGIAAFNGNVGIGTIAPTAPLDILTPAGFTRGLRIGPQNGNINQGSYIEFTSAIADGYGAQIGGIRTGNSGENALVFRTGTNAQAEQMRITNGGYVGIGTTSPDAITEIAGIRPSGVGGVSVVGAVKYGELHIQATDAYTTQKGGRISFGGELGTAYPKAVFGVIEAYKATNENNVSGSGLDFFTTERDDGVLYHRLRIDDNGNVGIGTTSPGAKLEINGYLKNPPAVSGTTQNGGLRIRASDGDGVLDFGTMSGGNGWIQSTNAPSLATNFGLLLNPNGGNVGIGTTDTTLAELTVDGNALLRTATDDARYITFQNSGAEFVVGVDGSSGNYIAGGAPYSSYFASGGTNPIQFGVNDSLVMTLENGGNVGIGTADPSTALEIGSSDLGASSPGPIITLGRNTNTNTGAGSINFMTKAGVPGYVWQDAAYNMRISTGAPSNTSDTTGTVIGTQTSTRDTKQDIKDYTDYSNALTMITNAPLHTFRYINEVNGYGTDSPLAKEHIGFIADEVEPMFMSGNAIDQVSVNGLLMASIKQMNLNLNGIAGISTIPASEKEVEDTTTDEDGIITTVYTDGSIDVTYTDGTIITTPAPESPEGKYEKKFFANVFAKVGDWLGRADNGIKKIFARKISTKLLCVADEAGVETCIVKNQLDNLLARAGSASASETNNTNGGVNTNVNTTVAEINPEAPVITLIGEGTINIDIGATYTELGANVTDDKDTYIVASITGVPDNSANGIYAIHYNAVDTDGNNAVEIIRNVIVGTGVYTVTGVSIDGGSGDVPVTDTPETAETTIITEPSSETTVPTGWDSGGVVSGVADVASESVGEPVVEPVGEIVNP